MLIHGKKLICTSLITRAFQIDSNVLFSHELRFTRPDTRPLLEMSLVPVTRFNNLRSYHSHKILYGILIHAVHKFHLRFLLFQITFFDSHKQEFNAFENRILNSSIHLAWYILEFFSCPDPILIYMSGDSGAISGGCKKGAPIR
jgi:hypothetical protein